MAERRRRRICQPLTQDGSTALICAAESGHADCVQLLLNAGADKNAKDEVRVGLLRLRLFAVLQVFLFALFLVRQLSGANHFGARMIIAFLRCIFCLDWTC